MPILNKRLTLAAEMLGQVKSVADIGTDHAFLPIYLIKEGLAERVIACDIAEGPLSVAKANITKYGLADKIELRLANGLLGLEPNEVDAVTILGMGGETIADILTDSPWVKNPDITLILQPMSCDDRLREYLLCEGFEIKSELGVESQGRFYTVMKVAFSGNIPKVGKEYKYIGKLLENPNAAAITFVNNRLKSMKACMRDIEKVERKRDLYNELKLATEAIEKMVTNYVK
ncbi:MAG: SAM-dependent methyltransferase [Clostridia bacterium]|nr:SAM-dependent methyltransferase [Clostridia bacterium]